VERKILLQKKLTSSSSCLNTPGLPAAAAASVTVSSKTVLARQDFARLNWTLSRLVGAVRFPDHDRCSDHWPHQIAYGGPYTVAGLYRSPPSVLSKNLLFFKLQRFSFSCLFSSVTATGICPSTSFFSLFHLRYDLTVQKPNRLPHIHFCVAFCCVHYELILY